MEPGNPWDQGAWLHWGSEAETSVQGSAVETERQDEQDSYTFDTPFPARGPGYYAWRDRIIQQGNTVIENLLSRQEAEALRMAAQANRDQAEEAYHAADKRTDKWKSRFETLKLQAEAHGVVNLQLQQEVDTLKARLQAQNPPQQFQQPIFSNCIGHFTIKASHLLTFKGERDPEKLITFLISLERAFLLRAEETMTTGQTRMWGEYAIAQLRDKAAEWGNHTWGVGEKVDWKEFREKITDHFVPADYLSKLKLELANLTVDPKKPLTVFNDNFKTLRLRLQIVTKKPGSDDFKPDLVDFYMARIQMAAANEKGDQLNRVYSAYVQWNWTRAKDGKSVVLSEVINMCA